VLIITCPCALGLAVPAVVTSASGRLFRKGLLIKSGTALERLAEVDTVVFDKTGTLTMGAPEPVGLDAVPLPDLAAALALARGSAHPLAQALARAIAARGVAPAVAEAVTEVPGHGIEARIGGVRVRLGRADWLGQVPGLMTEALLLRDGGVPVRFAFEDSIRPGAMALVAALRAAGMDLRLVSGDVPAAVEAFAARLCISHWTAAARPEDKAKMVRALAAEGRRVLMVGDGLNDTAALAEALVSISPATGLDAARAASDVVLVGRSLAPSTRRIRENFAISAAYNIVAVPLALMGLATPFLAAAAMSLSSITVTLNALRLR
jgi:P-type Cu2+ transporter